MKAQSKIWLKNLILISLFSAFSYSATAFEITTSRSSFKSAFKVNRLPSEIDSSELNTLIGFIRNPDSIDPNKQLANLNKTQDVSVLSSGFVKHNELIAESPKASTVLAKNIPQLPFAPLVKTYERRVVHFYNKRFEVTVPFDRASKSSESSISESASSSFSGSAR